MNLDSSWNNCIPLDQSFTFGLAEGGQSEAPCNICLVEDPTFQPRLCAVFRTWLAAFRCAEKGPGNYWPWSYVGSDFEGCGSCKQPLDPFNGVGSCVALPLIARDLPWSDGHQENPWLIGSCACSPVISSLLPGSTTMPSDHVDVSDSWEANHTSRN